jgi:hypothetical protein
MQNWSADRVVGGAGVLGPWRAQTGERGRGVGGTSVRFVQVRVHDIVNFFRRNPQALALLVIVLVLGIGTFIAVLVALGSSGSKTGPGYPSGTLLLSDALGMPR